MTRTALTGCVIFDGAALHHGAALVIEGGRVVGIVDEAALPAGLAAERLAPGWLAPGLVDLQVNGGGGVMFNDAPTVATLARIAAAHARLGTTAILPTLITDTPARTEAAIAAAVGAVAQGVPGIAGLHLEGPHLAPARKGAHDAGLIRPMDEADLAQLEAAAAALPALMVTVAVEAVTPAQIARLAAAGVVVSLGHTEARYEAVQAAVAAGARSATHLFNAMSQMTPREPGLVGAVLDMGALSAGVIADGFHVHPVNLAAAQRAKAGPGGLYLVSDAMATVGSDLAGFTLNGRWVSRAGGRLVLADGTLAGADLALAEAVQRLVGLTGTAPEAALTMASSRPAGLMGLGDRGHLAPGARADLVHLGADLGVLRVWQGGRPVNL